MYIASVTAEEQAAFTPQLNHEHSEYKWWDVAALVNADTQPALHPVVDLLLQVQRGSLLKIVLSGQWSLHGRHACGSTVSRPHPQHRVGRFCPLVSGQGGPGQVLPDGRPWRPCSRSQLPPAHLQLQKSWSSVQNLPE